MNMPAKISWSPSRVETHKKCPRLFYEQSVMKPTPLPYIEGPEQAEGNRVHRLIDMRIKKTAVLTGKDAEYEPLVASLERQPGTLLGEQKMTINDSFQPCGWFDKRAWCRLVVDAMVINGPLGVMIDWKTGKPRFDSYQLKLNAALGFIYYKGLEKITTAYAWLKTKTLDPAVYKREDAKDMWIELLDEPLKMQVNYERNTWPENPGWYCGWCGINKQKRCRVAKVAYRGD